MEEKPEQMAMWYYFQIKSLNKRFRPDWKYIDSGLILTRSTRWQKKDTTGGIVEFSRWESSAGAISCNGRSESSTETETNVYYIHYKWISTNTCTINNIRHWPVHSPHTLKVTNILACWFTATLVTISLTPIVQTHDITDPESTIATGLGEPAGNSL